MTKRELAREIKALVDEYRHLLPRKQHQMILRHEIACLINRVLAGEVRKDRK